MKRGAKLFATAAALVATGCGGERPELQIRPTKAPLSATARPVPYRIAEAHAHLALGNVALAIESFRKAHREQPDSVDAMVGLALSYDQMNRFDVSRRYYESALAIVPADTGVLNAFAQSLQQQGLTEKAAAVRSEVQVRLAAVNPKPAQVAQAPVQPQSLARTGGPAVGRSVTVVLPPARAAAPAVAKAPVQKAAPARPPAASVAKARATPLAPIASLTALKAHSAPLPAAPARVVPEPRPVPVVPEPRPVPVIVDAAPKPPAPAAVARKPEPSIPALPPAEVPSAVASRPADIKEAATPAPATPAPATPIPAAAKPVQAIAVASLPAVAPKPIAAPTPAPPVLAERKRVEIAAAPSPPPAAVFLKSKPVDLVATPSPLPAPALAERLPAIKPDETSSPGPRLERLSPGEVALVTAGRPHWHSKIVSRTARSTTVRFVPLRTAEARTVKIKLLNAARYQGLAARTRRLFAQRGWRQLAIGNARRVRHTSLILYPANRRKMAERLGEQFGIAVARRPSGTELVILLGRDTVGRGAVQG